MPFALKRCSAAFTRRWADPVGDDATNEPSRQGMRHDAVGRMINQNGAKTADWIVATNH
jgi:hypothetical protein